jgi:hypothetical protein
MDPPALTGYLCEVCFAAPAMAFVPAPGGGETGVCAACGGLPPAVPRVLKLGFIHTFDTGGEFLCQST